MISHKKQTIFDLVTKEMLNRNSLSTKIWTYNGTFNALDINKLPDWLFKKDDKGFYEKVGFSLANNLNPAFFYISLNDPKVHCNNLDMSFFNDLYNLILSLSLEMEFISNSSIREKLLNFANRYNLDSRFLNML